MESFLDYIATPGVETLVPPDEFMGRTVQEIMPPDVSCQDDTGN